MSEVIYKYRKQQEEAEHLHKYEVILLCTHCPIMSEVWLGHVPEWDMTHEEKNSYWLLS